MIRIYTSDNVAMAWHIRNLLEQQEIPVMLKNENLLSVAGEVPVTECLPEVWLLNEEDLERAQAILAEVSSSQAEPGAGEGKDWLCEGCGETNGANFGSCWNCSGAEHPDAEGFLDA